MKQTSRALAYAAQETAVNHSGKQIWWLCPVPENHQNVFIFHPAAEPHVGLNHHCYCPARQQVQNNMRICLFPLFRLKIWKLYHWILNQFKNLQNPSVLNISYFSASQMLSLLLMITWKSNYTGCSEAWGTRVEGAVSTEKKNQSREQKGLPKAYLYAVMAAGCLTWLERRK